MKYTSALNGELNPYFHDFSLVSTGRFSVDSVYLPGAKTSAIAPSLIKTAHCASRTVSCAPILISFPSTGKRYTMVSRDRSVDSITSINCDLIKSKIPMAISTLSFLLMIETVE